MIQLRRTTTYASRRDGASDATSNRHYGPRYRRFRRKRRGALPAIFSVTRAVWVIASSTSGFGPLRQFAAARQYVGYRGIADFASHPPGRFMGSRPSRRQSPCGSLEPAKPRVLCARTRCSNDPFAVRPEVVGPMAGSRVIRRPPVIGWRISMSNGWHRRT